EPLYFRRMLGSGAAPLSVANRGTAPAWRTVSITGVPRADLPAESSGYWTGRWIFRADGSPADLTKVRQTDLFVVVINGKRTAPAAPRSPRSTCRRGDRSPHPPAASRGGCLKRAPSPASGGGQGWGLRALGANRSHCRVSRPRGRLSRPPDSRA